MNWGSKLCMKTMADVVSLRMFTVCCHCSPMEDEKYLGIKKKYLGI